MRHNTCAWIVAIFVSVVIQPGIGQQDSIDSSLPHEHSAMLMGGGSSFLVIGGLRHLYSSAFSDSGVSTGEILAKSAAVAVPASLLGALIITWSGKRDLDSHNDFGIAAGWSVIHGLPLGNQSKWKHGIYITSELPSYGKFTYAFSIHHYFSERLEFGAPEERFNADLTFTALSIDLQWVININRITLEQCR